MSQVHPCPRCGSALSPLGAFALLPSEDVPEIGSRTEIVVTPTRALRVTALGCACGHIELTRLPLTSERAGATRA